MRSDMRSGGDEIIDAEYVVVEREPRRSRGPSRGGSTLRTQLGYRAPLANIAPVAHAPEPSIGMDSLKRSAQPAENDGRPDYGSPLFWAAGAVIIASAFWVSGGHTLAKLAHSTKPPVELRIAAFNSRVIESGVRPTLVVDGEAVNDGIDTAALRTLEIQVTSGNGTLTRYKLGTAGHQLAAGDVYPFSSRVDLPKHGVKTVTVAFVD